MLSRLNKKHWIYVSFITSFIAAILGCGTTYTVGGKLAGAVMGGTLSGLLTLLLTALLSSVNLKLDYLRHQSKNNYISLRELVNIRPLIDGPPLNYGHWAIDPFLGKILAQLISRCRPSVIVECGSGTSTAFMAKLLRRFNIDGRVVALDHLEEYAVESRRLLEEHNSMDLANVITAPLENWTVNGENRKWYGLDLNTFDPRTIDLLVVDGPPATIGRQARYPAAVLLEPYLANDCVIVLDDGDRESEKETAHQWAAELDGDLEYVGGPKGTYIVYL